MNEQFDIQFMPDVIDFFDSLDEKTREKIIYNINKARIVKDNELLKKLTDDLWEFRTLFNKTFYRLLAFWDNTGNEQTLVIATNGFIKRQRKPLKLK